MQFFLCQKSLLLDERLLLDVIIKYDSIQIFGGRYVNENDSAENTSNSRLHYLKLFSNNKLKENFYTNINENLNDLKTINSKTYWKTINKLLKGESPLNDIPPFQDPKNNYCLSYEGKEKADVINK